MATSNPFSFTPEELAHTFSDELRRELKPSQMMAVINRNRAEQDRTGSGRRRHAGWTGPGLMKVSLKQWLNNGEIQGNEPQRVTWQT